MDSETRAEIEAAIKAAKAEIMENVATIVAHPLQSGGEVETLAMFDDIRGSIARLLTSMIGQSFIVFAERDGDNIRFKRRFLTMGEGGKMVFSNSNIPDLLVPAGTGLPVDTVFVTGIEFSNKKVKAHRSKVTANGVVPIADQEIETIAHSELVS